MTKNPEYRREETILFSSCDDRVIKMKGKKDSEEDDQYLYL